MIVSFWKIFFLLLNCTQILCVKVKIECGYKQCPQTRDGTLNVHLIPHSHMDAGWVKTFDEYYYGTKTSISSANVQLIFHSVLSELLHDKRRKFTFSETAYFWRWWKEQRPTTRATFRSLVQEGRIEFAGGGWTHADSATVSYLQTLDLWTWGLRKLNDTLGPCGKPKAAWQIDTYGHTREQASLLAQMGFDGLFLGRVDHKVREEMMEEDRMEFMWRGSDVLGKMSDIMSHAMFNLYNAPNGFCFDWLCSDEPVIDDIDSPVYNADTRVNEFISQIERQAKYYDHDNIMVTMGGDFTYQNAANWFMNMDRLINHVNTHPTNLSDINIFYSTPSCYLKAIYLYGRRDKAIYTEKGDHLPYGSDSSTYWTGFYTSRPSFKYFVRKAHMFLQVLKQLSVITRTGDSYELHLLRHAVALSLHHDAITGTSQQHVANDFIKVLSEAVVTSTKKISNLFSYLTPTWGGGRRTKNNQMFVMCHQLNITQCRFVETQDALLVLVYNPLSVKTYHYVRLPAIALHYSVRDYNDEEMEYQLSPLPADTINLPGRASAAIQELWFEAENIPPLGYTSYYITPVRDVLEENQFKKTTQGANDPEQELTPFISNEYLKVTIDKNTGFLESIQHIDGTRVQMFQNYHWYGQPRQGLRSGAYSFRPDRQRPTPVTDKVQYNTVRGTLVKEIRQRFTDWISQVIRLYRGEELVEFEWTIGPVPIGSDLGKEVVSIFQTNITNNGEFFTDSNGRQMMKRTCWNETNIQQQKKPIAACYYPVTSRICINSINTSVTMCVLTDRTEGGTGYSDGEIELMVHRRLLTDDGFGLEESLNEEAFGAGLVVKGTHRILFGNLKHSGIDELTSSERVAREARRWEMEPWLFFTSGEKINRRKWQNVRNKRYSALRLHGLPAHIHVLTLEPWKGGTVLLRLENTLETALRNRMKSDNMDAEDTKSHITVDLRKIFFQHQIRLVRETTLAANQWLDDARQMDWSTRYVYNGGDDGILPEDLPEEEDRFVKNLEPKDSANYSEEELDRPKKHKQRIYDKSRTKIAAPNDDKFFDRRKRAVNETININDNVINDTIKDLRLNLRINEFVKPRMGNISPKKNVLTNFTVIKGKGSKDARGLPKLRFLNKPKLRRIEQWPFDIEEQNSSEEEFIQNLRKKMPKKKRSKTSEKVQDEIIVTESEDGITKSMYDMYYKPLPPKNPYKRTKTSEEGRNRKSKRRYDYRDEPSRTTRSKKRSHSDTSYFMIDKRRRRGLQKERETFDVSDEIFIHDETLSPRNLKRREVEMPKRSSTQGPINSKYDDEEDDYYDDYSEEDERRRKSLRNRRKRTLLRGDDQVQNTSEQEQNEPEYKVTLRPTQIRTFVVWFTNVKKVFA